MSRGCDCLSPADTNMVAFQIECNQIEQTFRVRECYGSVGSDNIICQIKVCQPSRECKGCQGSGTGIANSISAKIQCGQAS